MDVTALTVFVLTYNHENSVAQTIESILAQKGSVRFSVKILEDCSTDGTVEVCRRYARSFPDKVKLIAQERNTGALHLQQALRNEIDTPYFYILEGDDWLTDENYLSRAVTFLEEHTSCDLYLANCAYRQPGSETDCLAAQGLNADSLGRGISFANYAYLHTSTRVYRKVFDFARMEGTRYPFHYDIFLYWLYLDRGAAYLEGGHPVAVYNIHAMGVWNRMSDREKGLSLQRAALRGASFFRYRHAHYFARQCVPNLSFRILRKLLGDELALRALAAVSLDKSLDTRKKKHRSPG